MSNLKPSEDWEKTPGVRLTPAGIDFFSRQLWKLSNDFGDSVVYVEVDGELHEMTEEGEPLHGIGYAAPKAKS